MSKYVAYPAYKDSGIEWLGDVPEHWGVKRLKFFAQISNGQDQKQVVDDNGCYPIYGSGGIFGRSNECLYDQPSVLLGRKGTIDKPLFVTEPFWTVDTMYYTKIYPITFPKFFFYQCLTIQFAMYQYGSALPSMTQESLNGVIFSAPDFDEQEQIANFLDDKTAHLDKLIGQKQQMIGLLNEKRMALITQAVTKGLDLTVPMKDSGVEWLGDVPEHWDVVRFSYFIGFQEGPGILAVDFHDEGIPLLRIRNIQEKTVNLANCNYVSSEKVDKVWSHFRCKPGDLIISGSASMGFVSEVTEETSNCIVYTGLIRLWACSNKTIKNYIRWLVVSEIFFNQINLFKTGSTIQHFGPDHLNKMLITLPSVPEQQQISNYLDTETQKIDDMIKTVKQAIATLQEYRTVLITAAVTGKIDVRGFKLPKQTTLDDLAGCTRYHGAAKTLEDMDAAIEQGIIAKWGRHDSNL